MRLGSAIRHPFGKFFVFFRKNKKKTNMTQIYANGNKAGQLYKRYQFPVTGIEATGLPSTSPANAAWSLARLCEAWKTILHDL